jgi:crotonobetainyl-CoA:carnitine CoA-transferase CaiB-like acyl-CoA transferase
LADLGAEVIKVEEPKRGDYLRWFPPLKVQEGGMFLVLNRNKKSLTRDSQLTQRGMVVEEDHPVEGRIKEIGPPIKLSETPAELRMPPPRLGEHTREILASLGYGDAEVDDLREAGVI